MKRYRKRILAVLLIGTMVLSLAGCNRSSSDAENQVKKDFYYVPEYHDLELASDYIGETAVVGNTLYLYGSSWNEETGESINSMYQYDFLSGQSSELPVDFDGNDSVQQMCEDSEGNIVMIMSRYAPSVLEDAEDSESEDTEDAAGTEDADQQDDDSTGAEDNDEADETSGESVALSKKTVAGSVISDGDAADEGTYEAVEYTSYIELWKINSEDGSTIVKTDIKPVFEDADNAYVQYMTIDNEDNVYLSDGNSNIYVLDKDGNKICTISVENWVENLFATKEGKVFMRTWGNNGMAVKPVDIQKKSLGEDVTSENLNGNGNSYNQNYYKGLEKGILVSDNNGVFIYDFETDVREDLFSWLDADINSDEVSEIGQLSDGRIWAILRDYSEEKTKYSLVYLTKTPASEVPQKEELLFGTMWLNQNVRKSIIDFNKSNTKYHISVKEYSTDDYMTGLTQFNNDITSGNGPDIIDISNIDYKQYVSKGVLENLYPYMEKDGINKEDYLMNVLKAYEVDGKLYGIVPQFYITTTIAKASKVGDTPGWTLTEMLDFVEHSEAENIFQYGSRESIFYYCIYNNIDEFIDWETGECRFNGDDFIRVLEFANKFPEEIDYNSDEGISSKLRSDKVLLMQTSISSVQEYQMMNGLFGEKTTYIGYPNSERKGNLIQPTNGSVALNAKSKNKDGAWEFIKILLSDDYQNSLVSEWGSSWGFPLKKSALDKQFEKDMTPEYYEDENGNQVEQMKTSWGYDDFNMDIYAATQEEIDAVKEIITSAEKTSGSVNEELTNIITEETGAFFKGQKSAKDTADIIQNRIQIYVKENS